jgi:proteasome assembly chaperone (PAC2) family protein
VNVDEVLTTAFDGLSALHRPVMVLALRGWFDVAEVSTDACDELFADHPAPVVAAIDPDPFFDFTQERPQIEIDDAEQRQITWPENEFRVLRYEGLRHDLVVLSGVEPHLRFATFSAAIIEVCQRLDVEVVVTLGAAAEAVPHTRPPTVTGSTTNRGLAGALGLAAPRYQGMTGIVGVLQEALDRADIPAVSLRVGVPHYLGAAKHPQCTAALLHHLERVIGVPTGHQRLAEDAMRWRTLHDEAVADDPRASHYVAQLEREHDRHTEASIPSGEDLAAEFERFLREQRPDE